MPTQLTHQLRTLPFIQCIIDMHHDLNLMNVSHNDLLPAHFTGCSSINPMVAVTGIRRSVSMHHPPAENH
jgi:hypothetical protein